jgi:hypothetical protein
MSQDLHALSRGAFVKSAGGFLDSRLRGSAEKVLIGNVWFWRAYSVWAGLDRDGVEVVTCPQGVMEATGHTPRYRGTQDLSQLLVASGFFNKPLRRNDKQLTYTSVIPVETGIHPDAAWNIRGACLNRARHALTIGAHRPAVGRVAMVRCDLTAVR